MVTDSVLDELCNWCYDVLLNQNTLNDGIQGHGQIGKVSQHLLRIEVYLFPLVRMGYQYIKKVVEGGFLFRRDGTNRERNSVCKGLFDGASDLVIYTIASPTLHFGNDDVPKSNMFDAY